MRIIAGKIRGKKLNSPKDERVRPTLDRVKEAVFSMITYKINDAVVLDLFAGSGALGLESLSRGSKKAIFVDRDKDSIKLVKSNIKICNMQEQSEVWEIDAEDAIKKAVSKNYKFDIIFMDPPYDSKIAKKVLQDDKINIIINNNGIIIIETDKSEIMEDEIGDFIKTKEKNYGQTKISIYERK